MKQILEVAKEAALAAGEVINQAAEDIDSLHIEQKTRHDYVSEVDRNSETLITRTILENFPNHAILGEEFGSQGTQHAEYSWLIDPLDGTTNFLRSISHYAVSIAVLRGQQIQCAVVYDPAKREMFSAELGQGAFLNDKPISVSNSDSIQGALLATGVPFSGKNLQQLDKFTVTLSELLQQQTSGVRRLGAAALDLAYVAAGRYEGFWEALLKPWDIAAGVLLVQEAGGNVSDFEGEQLFLQSGDIVAANPAVHDAMLGIVQKTYKA